MKKGNVAALLPIGVFLCIYLGLGIAFEYVMKIPMGFYNVPIIIAFLAAILVACLQNRKISFDRKLEIMAQGLADKNIITRAVGVKEKVAADFFEVDLTKGDKLLLCSDGLTNMLRDEEIYQIIQDNKELEQAAKALVDAANENGGRDNIAVVLVEPFGGQE